MRDLATISKSIDDYAFGGGAGMVFIEPLYNCIQNQKERDYDEVIFMCPDGEQLTQPTANKHSLLENLIIICITIKVLIKLRDHIVTKEISTKTMFCLDMNYQHHIL